MAGSAPGDPQKAGLTTGRGRRTEPIGPISGPFRLAGLHVGWRGRRRGGTRVQRWRRARRAGSPNGRKATTAATSARYAPHDQLNRRRLEEKGQHHERGIDPGQEDQELILGQTALLGEVTGPEGGDQDVEHEHDGVEYRNEQPSVRAETAHGERSEAVPRKPQRDQEDQAGRPGNPVLGVQDVQALPRLPGRLGCPLRHDGTPDGGAALGAESGTQGHLDQAAGACRQSAILLPAVTDARSGYRRRMARPAASFAFPGHRLCVPRLAGLTTRHLNGRVET